MELRMDRTNIQVVIKDLHDEEESEESLKYIQSLTHQERLCILEFLRRQNYSGYNGDTDRLQRVYTIIERK